jgi:hypothetical protein
VREEKENRPPAVARAVRPGCSWARAFCLLRCLFTKIRSSLLLDELAATNWLAGCPARAATAPLGCLAIGPLTQLSSLSAI